MGRLFEVTDFDHRYYQDRIKDFIPDRIIDIHTHVWLDQYRAKARSLRSVSWPSRVARDNSIEDLFETYQLMFPEKSFTPLIFSSLSLDDDMDGANAYIRRSAEKHKVPALIYAPPDWSGQELERRVMEGGFLGCKVYLNLAKPYIPPDEIRIFDFLPPHQLEVMHAHGWIVILHIPRKKRLKDPVNLAQLLEIEEKYPGVKLVVAHVGRAYCNEDVGDAFKILRKTQRMRFDISANANQWVFEELIKAVGPKRILFGSDLPILRMRAKRVCENGTYVNIVPKGLYGDLSGERNMREVEGKEAQKITFFLYEEIEAFRQAAKNTGLSSKDIEDVFYNNAKFMLGIE